MCINLSFTNYSFQGGFHRFSWEKKKKSGALQNGIVSLNETQYCERDPLWHSASQGFN